jgi:hypothetical protein
LQGNEKGQEPLDKKKVSNFGGSDEEQEEEEKESTSSINDTSEEIEI